MPVSKPSNLARWSDVSGTKTAPTSGQQNTGFGTNAVPTSGFFNWLFNLYYTWIAYLDDLRNQAFTWTAAHIFSADVTLSSALNILTKGGSSNTKGVTVAAGDKLNVLGSAQFASDPTWPARSAGNIGGLGAGWNNPDAGDPTRAFVDAGGRTHFIGVLGSTSGSPSLPAFSNPMGRPLNDQFFFVRLYNPSTFTSERGMVYVGSNGDFTVFHADFTTTLQSGWKAFLAGVSYNAGV